MSLQTAIHLCRLKSILFGNKKNLLRTKILSYANKLDMSLFLAQIAHISTMGPHIQ